jgi:hypothetical protein
MLQLFPGLWAVRQQFKSKFLEQLLDILLAASAAVQTLPRKAKGAAGIPADGDNPGDPAPFEIWNKHSRTQFQSNHAMSLQGQW